MDYKSSIAQVVERLLDLLTGVHDEGAVGDDRFAERLPGEEHETQRVVDCLDVDRIPCSEDDHVYRFNCLVSKHPPAREHVSQGGVARRDIQAEFTPGLELDLQVDRAGGVALTGPVTPV
ncbi:MAG: hypothetical protein ABIJ39_09950 [Chloroflexota bacterium]